VKCGSLWTRNWKRTTSFEYGYTLGSVTDHALTHGVGSLSSSGFRGGAVAKGGTTVVASWSDGAPLVGYKTLSAGQLWKNAVHFAGAAGGPARVGVVAGGNLRRVQLPPFDHHRKTHPTRGAHRDQSKFHVASCHLVQNRHCESTTSGAEWVSDRK
jgi:hypothetical protein